MAWSIEREGSSASRIILDVVAGEVSLTQKQNTVIHETIGGNRVIWKAIQSKEDITIPPIHFKDAIQIQRLKNLLFSNDNLTLTDNNGVQRRVRGIDGLSYKKLNKPGDPIYEVTLNVVGA